MQAIKILNMIKVHGKPIRVNKASQDKKQLDVGANLFIGNIDPDVDEKVRRRTHLTEREGSSLLLLCAFALPSCHNQIATGTGKACQNEETTISFPNGCARSCCTTPSAPLA